MIYDYKKTIILRNRIAIIVFLAFFFVRLGLGPVNLAISSMRWWMKLR